MNQTQFEYYYSETNLNCRIYCDYSAKHHDYKTNVHVEPEFIYVISGCEIVHLENDIITALPGDIVAINSGKIHTITGENFVHHCIIPSKEFFRLLNFPLEELSFPSLIRDETLSAAFLNIIEECHQKKKYNRQFTILAIQKFLLYFFEKYSFYQTTDELPPKNANYVTTAKVMDYLRQHLSEDISISDIANTLGINEFYLCRCVKRATGKKIIDHLNSLRCNTAQHYLMHTDKKISEIAQLCGYQSPAYFSTIYRKVMGHPPKETPRNVSLSNPNGWFIV